MDDNDDVEAVVVTIVVVSGMVVGEYVVVMSASVVEVGNTGKGFSVQFVYGLSVEDGSTNGIVLQTN